MLLILFLPEMVTIFFCLCLLCCLIKSSTIVWWGFSFHLALGLQVSALQPVRIFSQVSTSQRIHVPACIWRQPKRLWIPAAEFSLSNCDRTQGVCHRGSLSSQPSLSCYCWKSPISVVPIQRHKLVGLGLKASYILMGSQRHCFNFTILTACDNKGLGPLRLPLGVHFLDCRWRGGCIFSIPFWEASSIHG